MVTEVTTIQYKSTQGQLYNTHVGALEGSVYMHLVQVMEGERMTFEQNLQAAFKDDHEAKMWLFRILQIAPVAQSTGPIEPENTIANVWAAALETAKKFGYYNELASNTRNIADFVVKFGVEQLLRGIGQFLKQPVEEEPIATQAEEHSKEYHVLHMGDVIRRESVVSHAELLANRLYDQGIRYTKPTA